MNLRSIPKIELHLHLDCSLSYKVVHQLDPLVTFDEFEHSFKANAQCHSLLDYLARAARGFELMQDPVSLEMVTLDLFDQLQADGVIYAEIRFAPYLHLLNGMNLAEVVEVVAGAVRKGIEKTGVEAGLILCTLRHFSEHQSMDTVKLVQSFKGNQVVGFDIAADEAGFPVDNHISAFHYARENGLHITAHAGEACGPQSVWETLANFYPSRIGHGVRSIEDLTLIEHLKKENIHLEVCPTSNIQTGIYKSIKEHPADFLFKSGISMSINTDGRTISNVTLTQEYEKLRDNFGWNTAELRRCNLNAIEAAFMSASKKKALKNRFLELWQNSDLNF
ncbi:MAG: adenosine deaminase [Saprospiraceae bacterium]|nr:adenosine deaminase [Saprospiraceae bacterium]